ncbi:metal-dependent hydrolase [Salinarimonas sp.]|uniref:metal-dependent hydrolase n=1 Tax=Salinarimonas sp. TaxID=2766526 RepID=UPI00391B57D7
MDPVTHAALGAVVGHALAGRRLGGVAALAGAMAGAFPDIDVLWAGAGEDSLSYWELHRGVTHALLFAPLAGIPLGLAGASVHAWARMRRGKPVAGIFPAWVLVCVAAILSHVLNDAVTVYGTPLFLPFSDMRVSIPAMPIIDPLFTLALLGALAVAAAIGWRARAARIATASVLALAIGYVALALAQNDAAERIARADPGLVAAAPARVETTTTILSPWLRRVSFETDDALHVGFVSTLARDARPIRWHVVPIDPRARDLAQTALATDQGRRYRHFAAGLLHPHLVTRDGRDYLRIGDARYGFPDGTLGGMWGVEWPLLDGAIVAGAGERYMARPRASLADLRELVSATLGRETERF